MNSSNTTNGETRTTDIAEGSPPVAHAHNEPCDLDVSTDIRAAEPSAMRVFFAWEKLRLFYNAALVLVALSRVLVVDDLSFEALLGGALIANVCFCAGPVAEGYLCWFRLPRMMTRVLVFCLGMLAAMALTIHTQAQQLAAVLH